MKPRRLFLSIISFVLISALVLATACQLTEKVPKSAEPSSAAESAPSLPARTTSTPLKLEQSTGSPVLPSVADVVAKVKPSVVAITTEVVTLDFFRRQYTQTGAGSGWIISGDGVIVTNAHVVSGAQSIKVILDDGSSYAVDTTTVHADSITDLAVMKINARGLPALKIGDSSKLRVGDWVVAIGNSLGQGIRATLGIVSRQDVQLAVSADQEVYGLIETDAAINPGNSGGPLVNMSGEVIGITSIKHSEVGVEGVGYAISTNEAIPYIQELISRGYISRAYLGVSSYTVDSLAIAQFQLKVEKGVLLVYVQAGSPAARAGLQAGDVVVQFNGQDVTTGSQLIRAIHTAKIGQEVEVVFWRGSNQQKTRATLIEKPQE